MISSALAQYNIDAAKLEEVEENLTTAIRVVFERHDVEMTPETEVIEAIQSTAAEMVVDLADRLDRPVAEQLKVLEEDVEDPYSDTARSTISFILGSTYKDSQLRAIHTISGSIIADEHS